MTRPAFTPAPPFDRPPRGVSSAALCDRCEQPRAAGDDLCAACRREVDAVYAALPGAAA